MVTHLHPIELAERWRISPRTLEQFRWKGVGPKFLKINGGRITYRLADIEAYEAAHLRSSTSDDGSNGEGGDSGMSDWLNSPE
jgi:hypothetical protein